MCRKILAETYNKLKNLHISSSNILPSDLIEDFYREIYIRLNNYCELSFLLLFNEIFKNKNKLKLNQIVQIIEESNINNTICLDSHDLGKEIFVLCNLLDQDIDNFDKFSNYVFSFRKKEFDKIKTLLYYVHTIPSNTASAERGFSNLKYLKNHLRTTQSSERMESILLLYSEVDISERIMETEGEIRQILKIFA